jgi:hypothetical protein
MKTTELINVLRAYGSCRDAEHPTVLAADIIATAHARGFITPEGKVREVTIFTADKDNVRMMYALNKGETIICLAAAEAASNKRGEKK